MNSSQEENVDLCVFVRGMVWVMISQDSHEGMANQHLDDLQSGTWEWLRSRLSLSVLPLQSTLSKQILCISLHIYGSSYAQSMHITLILVASTFLFLLAFSILEGSNWQQWCQHWLYHLEMCALWINFNIIAIILLLMSFECVIMYEFTSEVSLITKLGTWFSTD